MERKTRSGVVKTYYITVNRNGEVQRVNVKARSFPHARAVLTSMWLAGELKDCYLLSPAEEPKRLRQEHLHKRRMAGLTGPGPFYSGVQRHHIQTARRGRPLTARQRAMGELLEQQRMKLSFFGPYSKQLLSNTSKHKERSRARKSQLPRTVP